MLRLTHAPPLDILRDGTAGMPLEADLELARAHAGDVCQALKRNVKGVMVGDIAYHVFESLHILSGKRARMLCRLLFLIIHNEGDRFCDLCLVEKRRRYPLAAIVFDLEQQLGHGGKIRRLIDALKRRGQIKVFVRILHFEMILIISRKNLDPDRVDRNALMNDRLVILLAADDGLNASRRQATVGVQLLAGNGIISYDADPLGDVKIQDKIIVKIEIVDLDIKQILLSVQPVVTAAERGGQPPAASCRAELLTVRNRNETAFR